MPSNSEDWLSANGVQDITEDNREPSIYDKYGLQLFIPRQVIYLNGTPTSMWLQLGNARCIEKMQKRLNELTSKPISAGFAIRPKVGKLYSIVWAQDKHFYRAQIDREIDEETYIARFVDYGNDEVVSLDQIYYLPEKHRAMFEQIPPQAYNCCLKGFECSGLSSRQDVLNATTISPQNMQLFEHLLQSSAESQPTAIFQPNSSCHYLKNKVPPYIVTLQAHINVNRFVHDANLMQPYVPPKLGGTAIDYSYEPSIIKEDEQIERSSWLGKDVSLIQPYIPPRLTSTAIDITSELHSKNEGYDDENRNISDWLESDENTLHHHSPQGKNSSYINSTKLELSTNQNQIMPAYSMGNNKHDDNLLKRGELSKNKATSRSVTKVEPERDQAKTYASNGLTWKENKCSIPTRSISQKSDEQLPSWDPMKEEFLSNQNQVAPDYGIIRNEEYETADGRRICKFFRSKGICFRGKNCEYLHIFTGSDFHSNKGDVMIVPELLENLPEENDFIIIQLGHINNPDNFFVNMPFGKLELSPYNNIVNINKCLSDLIKNKTNILIELQCRMTRYYETQKHKVKNENSSFSPGEIVAARSENGLWRRARITDTEAHPDPFIPLISVQFVDYGNRNDIRITDVRKLDKTFLDMKFQALECKLEGLMPKGGNHWQNESVQLLKNTTEELYLIAEVKKVYTNDVLGLDIYKRGSLENIADLLILKGTAKSAKTNKIQESYRIPG